MRTFQVAVARGGAGTNSSNSLLCTSSIYRTGTFGSAFHLDMGISIVLKILHVVHGLSDAPTAQATAAAADITGLVSSPFSLRR